MDLWVDTRQCGMGHRTMHLTQIACPCMCDIYVRKIQWYTSMYGRYTPMYNWEK